MFQDSIMEYDRLIDQEQNGTFCILFQNRHSLELEEIREIFSKFGTVHKINTVGDQRGYRFIRYKSYNEAKNAIDGLKDHPQIKFAVPRNKIKSNKDNHSEYSKNFSSSNSIEKFKSSNNSEKSFQKESTKSEKYNKNTLLSEHLSREENIKYKNESSETGSLCSRNSSANNKFYNHISPMPSQRQSLNSIPTLINGNKKELSSTPNNNEIPNLTVGNGKVSEFKHKKVILDAEEVIVGNIHPDYGAPYILHLFDRFEPIAISKINIVEETGTRYCHVYFKSVEDSLAAETLYDQTDLSGQKLVVLRPCCLMEEAVP